MNRCKSMSPHPEGGQCGLPEGHLGDHTLLIPTGAPWNWIAHLRQSVPVVQPSREDELTDAKIVAIRDEHLADENNGFDCIVFARSILAAASSREAEMLARKFHEVYERLAPSFGYATRTETREFDSQSPNGKLMIAVCDELMAREAELRQPNNDEVICPGCTHQFRAIPENVQAELATLRAALAEISAAIGTNQYMDPPDGGSVTLAEQVHRMNAALAERQAAIDELVACDALVIFVAFRETSDSMGQRVRNAWDAARRLATPTGKG